MLVSELLARKPPGSSPFNVGNYTLSVAAAWAVLSLGGWSAPRLRAISAPRSPSSLATSDLALSWLAYHLVNLALVAGACQAQTWWESFTQEFWFYTVSTMAVLALSPLVAVVAVADDARLLDAAAPAPPAPAGRATHSPDVPGA